MNSRTATFWLLPLMLSGTATQPLRAQPARGATIPTRIASAKSLPLPEAIGSPGEFVGAPGALAFYDFSDNTLYRADASGQWLPGSKRVGGGLGELRQVAGLQFAGDNVLWISDRGNSRVSGRDATSKVTFEITLPSQVGRIAPTSTGFISVGSEPGKLATVHTRDGAVSNTVAMPADIGSQNPMFHERFLVRLSDTMSVLQFRWTNRRIALRSDGRILYDSVTPTVLPRLVQKAIPGGVATFVDPKARSYAYAAAARGDTVLVLLGHTDDAKNGREVLRTHGPTGRVIDRLQLPVPLIAIAATRRAIFGIGEADDGYVLYEIVVK